MADIDPATAYRTLTQRATALRAEAEAARKQSVEAGQDDDRRFGLRRDELDRERGTLVRDAELADAQVKKLEDDRQTMLKSSDQFEADLTTGKRDAGDVVWKRNVEEGRAAAEQLAERAAAARADAAATRERLAAVDRKIVELDNEVRVSDEENQGARMAIFALDDQTRHVEEAARRYGEAAAAGDDIPARAAGEVAAEQALRSAESTMVDRGAIRRVIPTFPEQTPGLQDHPWPPPPPVIGPEETLDPFADAATADGRTVAANDTTPLSDPFDGTFDDDRTTAADTAEGAGDDPAWLDREAAQLGAEQTAALDTSGFDALDAGSEIDANVASVDRAGSSDVASSSDALGYDDVAATTPTFDDPTAADFDTDADDASSAFSADDVGSDEYASMDDSGGDDTSTV